ncbi:MAG: hypothetical protein UH542_06070 [Bacteroidales bacterium]|nr:hypothetical protein [Bacteroidales bacterium]
MGDAKNVERLLELVKTNPDLPVVPVVDNEVVGNFGYSQWMGEFGCVEVGEYTLYDDRFLTDRGEFKEMFYENNDDALCDKFHYNPRITEYSVKQGICTQEQLEKNDHNYELLENYLDEVAESAFVKAIMVDIKPFIHLQTIQTK